MSNFISSNFLVTKKRDFFVEFKIRCNEFNMANFLVKPPKSRYSHWKVPANQFYLNDGKRDFSDAFERIFTCTKWTPVDIYNLFDTCKLFRRILQGITVRIHWPICENIVGRLCIDSLWIHPEVFRKIKEGVELRCKKAIHVNSCSHLKHAFTDPTR